MTRSHDRAGHNPPVNNGPLPTSCRQATALARGRDVTPSPRHPVARHAPAACHSPPPPPNSARRLRLAPPSPPPPPSHPPHAAALSQPPAHPPAPPPPPSGDAA